MAANEDKVTRFPGGVAQFTFAAVGAAAGNVTATGVNATDELLLVQSVAFDADGDITAVADLTSEFSITAANTINNGGGTSTADEMVLVTVARTRKG
jgi:hypothetical protein